MGESLYKKFLDDRVDDLNEAVLRHGVENLLAEFEDWLEMENYLIKQENRP